MTTTNTTTAAAERARIESEFRSSDLWQGFSRDLRRNDVPRAAVRLTIAAVLQHAEDVTTARRRRASAARLARITAAASTMYKEYITRHPEDRSRETWYEALRQAAREDRGESARDRLALDDIRAALEDGQSPQAADVIQALRVCAYRLPRYAETRTTETADGQRVFTPSPAAGWMGAREPWAEAVEHVIGEAWTRLPHHLERVSAAPGLENPAAAVLMRAAWAACLAIDREYNPHRRSKRSPEERARMELRMIGGRPTDPEAAAVAADILHRAAPTPEDMLIVELTAAGVQQRLIAARLGLPQYTVSRRLAAIRDRASAIMHG